MEGAGDRQAVGGVQHYEVLVGSILRLAFDLNLGLYLMCEFLNVDGAILISDNYLLDDVIVMITDFFLS